MIEVLAKREKMKIINNISERLGDDLKQTLRKGSKVSIAASYFSLYAYEALMKELKQVDEVRFIFTSPTFVTDRQSGGDTFTYMPLSGFAREDLKRRRSNAPGSTSRAWIRQS